MQFMHYFILNLNNKSACKNLLIRRIIHLLPKPDRRFPQRLLPATESTIGLSFMTTKDSSFWVKLGRWGAAVFLTTLVVGTNGCEGIHWNEGGLAERVRSHGEIRILTVEHPLIYSRAAKPGGRGLEADLLRHFARAHDLRLRFIVRKDLNAVWESLRRGEGDVAAVRLRGRSSREIFLSTPAFETTHLSLFCRRSANVKSLDDLAGKRVLLRGRDAFNSLDVRLRQLTPSIRLKLVDDDRVVPLFTKLHRGHADCVITENLEGAWLTRRFLSVRKVAPLSREYSLTWFVHPSRPELHSLLKSWIQTSSRTGDLSRIQDRYRSALSGLDEHDVRRFLRSMDELLPRFENHFRAAARVHGLDWRLVASVAYQESQWNPSARSHTGVLGLMQLTKATAATVGVEDRLDPIQSIRGGASYLRFLRDRVPARIEDAEAWSLALAAYNCGWGHLGDARALAVREGLNPSTWTDLRKVLPSLEDPERAAEFRFGPARGRETVQFVERVQAFYNLWHLLL